ncbi:energy-coupling factor ABC transporter ATP-binding protein [Roseivivax isoporae]|uniref:Cobalt ABC transporter n=1 Tax=Roseivivax isoporae LMG 25204 TaxID=1449351 RepID=X7F876_9RHOB|nr:ABC transporter ATP-binding protein [Roseivivax isoporae]ETX28933.1 cobalt ABC transporter [Roseivivax isoporae LMG 25204]
MIEVEDVTVSLGGRRVLDSLRLSLPERRIGIVGRNGSGKSTLARAIAGLIVPEAGRVTIGGADMARDRRAALRSVGILFQNPDHQIIFPTVEEELAFGLRQLGRDPAGAAEMLVRFGRADWAGRPVAELSQGQRHLVCLMAVLAMRPRVILFDEPFSGLDIPTTRALRALVAGLEETVIQITHDPAAIDGYDRVVWIDAGTVRADGPPAAVLPAYLAEMEAPDAERLA